MRSKEYEEGFHADSYSDNPYDSNSHEFDEFERGRTQRIKRMPDSGHSFSGFSRGPEILPLSDLYKGKRLVMPPITSVYRYKNNK